jgi:hypothetical protein
MASKVFSAYKNGPEDVPSSLNTIGSLSLPAGKYAIFAKLYLTQDSGNTSKVQPNQVTARLEAGGAVDVSVVTVGIADETPFRSGADMISLNVVHEFTSAGSAVVKLDKNPDLTPYLSWNFLKITAIEVDSLQNTPIP